MASDQEILRMAGLYSVGRIRCASLFQCRGSRFYCSNQIVPVDYQWRPAKSNVLANFNAQAYVNLPGNRYYTNR